MTKTWGRNVVQIVWCFPSKSNNQMHYVLRAVSCLIAMLVSSRSSVIQMLTVITLFHCHCPKYKSSVRQRSIYLLVDFTCPFLLGRSTLFLRTNFMHTWIINCSILYLLAYLLTYAVPILIHIQLKYRGVKGSWKRGTPSMCWSAFRQHSRTIHNIS